MHCSTWIIKSMLGIRGNKNPDGIIGYSIGARRLSNVWLLTVRVGKQIVGAAYVIWLKKRVVERNKDLNQAKVSTTTNLSQPRCRPGIAS